jgi:hypothetical protein
MLTSSSTFSSSVASHQDGAPDSCEMACRDSYSCFSFLNLMSRVLGSLQGTQHNCKNYLRPRVQIV